ncbi:sugar ABC transporter ATP-binding protein [Rhodocytophaga aerolata]|uniref:Sugar ABC transporter ATP-binding protein n=1 Tax=Rhodocytophaga aerolata TaxID=455078 RepID=A0ABT8R6F4_9BACT|nr:sugar ABC transporter ATP-binding protein [Rhodocytophaga aerolata]MDO1447677.1 sugar ABC transporter ATP-binding protein [Rhodocytophaga aerolata]
MPDTLLKLTNIIKTFGPVKALGGVQLEVAQGEIHALIGENGAGKSTLMKILSGAEKPDSGEIMFDGKPYHPQNPAEGRLSGIAMIYQELNLAPHLTIEENITLGIEKSKLGFAKSQKTLVQEALRILGQPDLDPSTPVNTLSIAKQQLVEIARALVLDTKLVILDEPTSSLTAADTQALFEVIARLKAKGIAVIYISHFLEEVQQICDRFTVLRDGQTVGTGSMAGTSIQQLIEQMVGRSLEDMYPHIPHTLGEPVLEVQALQGKSALPRSASFTLHRGEILGISGLVGAGRTEMIRCLFGLDKVANGKVTIMGRKDLQAHYLRPEKALDSGLDLLSENRKEEGLAVNLPIFTNITLSALKRVSRFGWLNLAQEKQQADEWCTKMNVKCRDSRQEVGALSGGNQQKVSIARLLNHNSDIFFMDEPTRGIDVGSKAEIYRLIQTLASQGKSIVMISSYLPELLGICDTLAVMHRGELSAVKPISTWTDHDIMLYATSGVAV